MAFITLSTWDLMDRGPYDWRKSTYGKPFIQKDVLKKQHTYLMIFNNKQQDLLAMLKRNKNINILFESPMAVNKRQGHGTKPRNTVYVFELKD
jgi:hypothetical protein